ncbi:hypothetical protein AAVH_01814 [Aphelenchoides avenae]|nr:hypothetical protein AAVH_01814 [Aphelenchus avenae]
MSSKVDEGRAEGAAHTTPTFLSTFSDVSGNDDEGCTTSWNSRLVGYGDDDSDTDETSPSPIEAAESSSNGSPDEPDTVTLLEKKIEEMKKAHSMDKDKARQKLDDLEEKLRLRDLKIKVLEKKQGTTSVSKLESSVTVKENETRKLEAKLQKVQEDARRRERHLAEQLEEQKVQYKLLKTEANNAKHDLKQKSTKFLELQDDCEKLKKAYTELKGKYDKFLEADGNGDKHEYKQKYLELQGEVDRMRKSYRELRDKDRTEADGSNVNRDYKEKYRRLQEEYDKLQRSHHESRDKCHNARERETQGMQTDMGDWMKHVDGTVSKVVDTIVKKAETDMAHRVSQLVNDLDALKKENDLLTLEKQHLMKQVEDTRVLQEALEKLQAGCEALTQKYEEAQQAAKQETEKLCEQVIHLQTQLEQAEEAHRHCSDIFIDESKPELDKLKRKYERMRQMSEEQARALTTEVIKLKNEANAAANQYAMELRKVSGERDRQLQLVKHFTASATHHADEMARLKQDLKDAKGECAELKQTHEVVIQTMRVEATTQVAEMKGHVQELYEEVKGLRDRCKTQEATIASLLKKVHTCPYCDHH